MKTMSTANGTIQVNAQTMIAGFGCPFNYAVKLHLEATR